MHASDTSLILDRKQLQDITLDDEELMREVLTTLIDDTGRQLTLLDSSIRQQDSLSTARLAHYCKGACANVGANRAAATLKQIEVDARRGDFDLCSAGLQTLVGELDELRHEAAEL